MPAAPPPAEDQAIIDGKKPWKPLKRATKPLPDPADEHVVQWAKREVNAMSLRNARRLVHTYGRHCVEAALKRVFALQKKEGKVRNPCGLLITISRGKWLERNGYSRPFKAEKVRRRRRPFIAEKDPLAKSKVWVEWRIGFAVSIGDFESIKRWNEHYKKTFGEDYFSVDW